MTDQLLALPLTDHLDDLISPRTIHRLAMAPLPDLAGSSRSIRADLGVQFRLSLPTEIDGRPGSACLRYRSPLPIPGAELLDAPDRLEAGMSFTVRVVAMTRMETRDGRTHQRPVFDEVVEPWAMSLLERHGLAVDQSTVKVTARWSVGRTGDEPTRRRTPPEDRRRRMPAQEPTFVVRDLTAALVSTPASTEAYDRGIGRGRAYGFGMILPL